MVGNLEEEHQGNAHTTTPRERKIQKNWYL
jgi:hypothetical protein